MPRRAQIMICIVDGIVHRSGSNRCSIAFLLVCDRRAEDMGNENGDWWYPFLPPISVVEAS